MIEILALAANILRCFLRNGSIIVFSLVLTIFGTFSFYYIGDKSGNGFHLGLSFALSGVIFLLIFGLLVKSCFYVSESYESWQVHLYYVRPISAVKFFCGHVLGFLLYAITSLITFILIFGSVVYLAYGDLSKLEQGKAAELILEPREYEAAQKRDFSKLAKKVLAERLAQHGLPDGYTIKVFEEEILNSLEARTREFSPHQIFEYNFNNVNSWPSEIVYTLHAMGNFGEDERVKVNTSWRFYYPDSENYFTVNGQVISGEQVKLEVPDKKFISDGKSLRVAFENTDEKSVYFDGDGLPKVASMPRSFLINGMRLLFFTLLRLVYFIAMGVALALAVSGPVALVVILSYSFFCGLVKLELFGEVVNVFLKRWLVSPFSNMALDDFSNGIYHNFSSNYEQSLMILFGLLFFMVFANSIYKLRQVALVLRKG